MQFQAVFGLQIAQFSPVDMCKNVLKEDTIHALAYLIDLHWHVLEKTCLQQMTVDLCIYGDVACTDEGQSSSLRGYRASTWAWGMLHSPNGVWQLAALDSMQAWAYTWCEGPSRKILDLQALHMSSKSTSIQRLVIWGSSRPLKSRRSKAEVPNSLEGRTYTFPAGKCR